MCTLQLSKKETRSFFISTYILHASHPYAYLTENSELLYLFIYVRIFHELLDDSYFLSMWLNTIAQQHLFFWEITLLGHKHNDAVFHAQIQLQQFNVLFILLHAFATIWYHQEFPIFLLSFSTLKTFTYTVRHVQVSVCIMNDVEGSQGGNFSNEFKSISDNEKRKKYFSDLCRFH